MRGRGGGGRGERKGGKGGRREGKEGGEGEGEEGGGREGGREGGGERELIRKEKCEIANAKGDERRRVTN